jgi:hypothetical protein
MGFQPVLIQAIERCFSFRHKDEHKAGFPPWERSHQAVRPKDTKLRAVLRRR